MRVISGKLKGRQIHPAKGFQSRPTTDFGKESLFNYLTHRVDLHEIDVLDLFAGTGSISYEFVSRGANTVISVDQNEWSRRFINKTAKEFGIDNLRMLQFDVFRFLKKTPETFDLIFADPPFDLRDLDTIPDKIFAANILREEGLLILEHGPENDFSKHELCTEVKTYGHVTFAFFEHK
ncbi:MAG: 16S rRNA (guanine966-N2)-methyltransferase [Flavobacteriales bacterium]|jgi:16S rRNA (guanine966-N2)-methyltransferase